MAQTTILHTFSRLSGKIEEIIEFIGRASGWLILAMVLLVNYDIAMRYLFSQGSVAIQEAQWHLFSLIFLLGGAYTMKQDGHVRLDIFYKSRFASDKYRAWLNLFGSLFILFPFCISVIAYTWPFALQSYTHMESSPDPGGLPHRWILKASIILGFTLLILQGISDALKNLNIILTKEHD